MELGPEYLHVVCKRCGLIVDRRRKASDERTLSELYQRIQCGNCFAHSVCGDVIFSLDGGATFYQPPPEWSHDDPWQNQVNQPASQTMEWAKRSLRWLWQMAVNSRQIFADISGRAVSSFVRFVTSIAESATRIPYLSGKVAELFTFAWPLVRGFAVICGLVGVLAACAMGLMSLLAGDEATPDIVLVVSPVAFVAVAFAAVVLIPPVLMSNLRSKTNRDSAPGVSGHSN